LACDIIDPELYAIGDYLGYTESEFVSPTLVQNCINNYKFESSAGWFATASEPQTSTNKAKALNVYGRFTSDGFVSMTDDFYSGQYNDKQEYFPCMKL
jgi:hypothetical protein